VSVRDPYMQNVSRQRKLRNPTCYCKDIASAAVDIICGLVDISKPIRAITVTGMDICKEESAGVQQTFFDCDNLRRERSERLERTLDSVRARFGGDSVVRASSINSGLGI